VIGEGGRRGKGGHGAEASVEESEHGKKFLCLMINDSQCYNVMFEEWNGNSFLMKEKGVINHSALSFSSTRAN
jgi:hypothetical protein